LLEHCRNRGLDETTFNRLTSDSLILEAQDGTGYSVVGSILPIPAPQNVDGEPGSGNSTNCRHGFLSEGQLFLSWDLNATAIQGGALRVPEQMNTLPEGDYKLKTLLNCGLGSLHVRQRACWDVRRLLMASGADAEDTLVLIFSLQDHTVTGIVGDADVVTRVASGWPNLSHSR
jgi:hypothetical protein